MKRQFWKLILLLGFTMNSYAATAVKLEKKVTPESRRKSNFSFALGLEALNTQYNLGIKTIGKKENFQDYDSTLFGLRATGNMELYLGSSFSTTTTVSAYGSAAIVDQQDKFSETIDAEVGHYKKDNTFIGFEAGQSINMSFYSKGTDLDIQPFIGMYFGQAKIKLDVDYKYDDLATVQELLKANINDDITYTKITIGSNFVSKTGLFSYFSMSLIQVIDGKRSGQNEFKAWDDGGSTVDKFSSATDFEALYQVSLGVGSKF